MNTAEIVNFCSLDGRLGSLDSLVDSNRARQPPVLQMPALDGVELNVRVGRVEQYRKCTIMMRATAWGKRLGQVIKHVLSHVTCHQGGLDETSPREDGDAPGVPKCPPSLNDL